VVADLKDRIVVITGAGQGLGRAYAEACARAGAAVVVNDIDLAAAGATVLAITDAGGNAVVSGHSVSDPDAAEALILFAQERFGAVDCLVNNAGLFHVALPLQETPAAVRRSIEVNLLGSVYCAMAALPRLRVGGAIVNITSGAALGMKGLGVYGAGKAGIMALTRAWAMDLDPGRLAICAVSPVAVTRMLRAAGRNPEGCAPPEALAPVIVHLLSGGARMVHGETLRVTADGLAWVTPPRNGAPFATLADWVPEDLVRHRPG
jgi:NAD(P)-dependent dehydrogenase (short-subunit alcohol dehydrogenase family)